MQTGIVAELSAMGERGRRRLAAVALVALVAFCSVPALSAIGRGHDLTFHLYRIAGIAQGLAEGQFPVRMQYSQLNGMGYPLSIMYGDLVLYPPAVLVLFGLSVTAAYRVLVVAVNAFVVATAYTFLRRFSGSRSVAFAGTAVWSLGTYRLVDVYLRAAVGEYAALAFTPVIAYGLWCAFTERGRASTRLHPALVIALGMAGILQSHALSVLLSVFALGGVLVSLAVFGDRRARGWLDLLIACAAAVALSLWFLVPFAEWSARGGMRLTSPEAVAASNPAPSQYASTLGQLLSVFPVLDGNSTVLGAGAQGEMPLAAGAGALLMLLLAAADIALALPSRGGDAPARRSPFPWPAVPPLAFLLASTALLVVPALWDSGLPLMGLLAKVQFPWRLTGAFLFVSVLLGVFALARARNAGRRSLALACCAAVALLSIAEGGFEMSSFMRERPVRAAISTEAAGPEEVYLSVINKEYLPADLDLAVVDRVTAQLAEGSYPQEGWTLSRHSDGGRVFDVSVGAGGPRKIELPLIWYEGYGVVSGPDGASVRRSADGLVEVAVPEGFSGTVGVRFTAPAPWGMATAASGAAAAGCAVWAGASLLGSRRRGRPSRGSAPRR